jgi:DNA-binding GntR family transcriptional regulator
MKAMVKSQAAPGPDIGAAGPTSLADRAYEAIQDRLVRLDIRPGAPISEEELCASLGLSRTPVREALKRLERDRLVVAYPRRGTFATEINVTDLRHIFEVRELIEPAGAASAARHATARDRGEFRALAAELNGMAWPEAAPDELMVLDMRVHRAVYSATHNPYLEDTLVHYENLATRIWWLFLDRLPRMAAHIEEHRGLLDALTGGDAARAADVARQHVTGFDQAIRAVL